MRVPSLGREDPLQEGMATHSSILAWRIPWTEEPGGLQSQKELGTQLKLHSSSSSQLPPAHKEAAAFLKSALPQH